MKPVTSPYPRGAEWRQWDLHVHTPASFEWTGKRLWQMDADEIRASMDEMIAALNSAAPCVFAIMDYWTFEGWFALKRRLAEPGAPKLLKVVFPGIELRLVSPTKYRLNAHVLFSDEVTEQDLNNFRSTLKVALIEQPLSPECLQRLAREKLGADFLSEKGFNAIDVAAVDEVAFMAGCKCAEVTPESYKEAIARVPNGNAIGLMPWDTNDGLAKADWKKHYAYVIGLMKASLIFETRREELWAAFAGMEVPANREWIKAFQTALDNKPRLAVSGSDAHRFTGVSGDDNRRGYGDFPSEKLTWIKADPTFRGLLQAIKEPAKRSYIGLRPSKLEEVEGNKTFYIDAVSVQRSSGKADAGKWLDGCELPVNTDLVAIIGNKGSGKSALADVIALLGNSRQKAHFSFLKKDRFRGKSGEPAKHFTGTLIWRDGSHKERNLADDPPMDAVELVRYIPQGHFEELCNEHVSGRSNAFERELRGVIFAHADEAIRLGALDFDQLIEQQEVSFRDHLGELRKDLGKLNLEIAGIEEQLNPNVKRSLKELLTQKERQIDEHKKIAPKDVPKPSATLTPEQQAVVNALEQISATLATLETRSASDTVALATLARKQKAVQNLRERMRILDRAYKQFTDDAGQDFEVLGLNPSDLAVLTQYFGPLDAISTALPIERQNLEAAMAKTTTEKIVQQEAQAINKSKLDAPQLTYQAFLKARSEWAAKLAELTGSANAPETLEGLKARIVQLDNLPNELDAKRARRLEIAGLIFDVLDEQRQGRARLFAPVQDLIQANTLIRDGYKLQFQASLGGAPEAVADSLFDLIKQNSGEFRGGDESFAAVKKIADQHDFRTRVGILGFITELHSRILQAAAAGDSQSVGIASALRKDRNASDVYDLLFGLSFLAPRYSLLFQDTEIEQLSPGQRGALLLIFYLLVDKGRNPIILDQPEENLDNETVVSLLVPVLNEAKKKRQIIMVTHNPNLAVVCDAEQVIHSTFNRKGACAISYSAGSIEFTAINTHVVNVLEGTKAAFNNRGDKYH